MNLFKYQNKKDKNYFEGWYFRFTDTRSKSNFAVIFALTKHKTDSHSFIQVLDAKAQKSYYYKFDMSEFSYDEATKTVSIGVNKLNVNELYLKTVDFTITSTTKEIQELQLYGKTKSAMGFLQNAPLECFQEVIFMEARSTFKIVYPKRTFSGVGKSYMEKTYGRNFPKKWVWLQSNYGQKGSKLSFSVGLIPVLFFRVKGFFLILNYEGKEERLTSYNLSRVKVRILDEYSSMLIIKKGKTKVEIVFTSEDAVKLIGPRKHGLMSLDVFESITSKAGINVFKNSQLIYNDVYENVGVELMY